MNTSDTHPASAHPNEDPLSHEHGAHPVAAGVGAAGAGAVGVAIGTVLGGPIGGVVGALIGAVAGGLGGSSVGETINPTVDGPAPEEGEPVPWHEVIPSHLPSYEEVALRAYGFYEAEGRPEGQDVRHWLSAEESLRTELPPGETFAEPVN